MRQFSDGWNNPDNLHSWLLAFCAGVISLRFLEQLPPPGLTVAAAALAALLAVRGRWLRPVAAYALGFCWAGVVAAALLDATIPVGMEKRDAVISGRVVGVPAAGEGYQRFDFEVEQLQHRGVTHPSPGKIRLKIYQDQPRIRSGQRWRLTGRLKRARGFNNPGALFNYETHLFHHRLRATGYVRTRPPPVLLKSHDPHSVAAFRARAAGFIRDSLEPGGRAGLVTALAVGLRSDMRDRDWEVLVRTGTIHLVAISGLHIGLVSGLVMLVCGWGWRFAGALPLRLPAPKAGVAAGLLAGFIYALLAGMTIPTQRAVCMLAAVAVAMFFQRRPFGAETLVLALAVVLAFDPLAPLAAGFWLSFGAVGVLVIGVARTRTASRERSEAPSARRVLRQLGAWSAIQMLLFIGMAPLLLALFHRVSIAAPLANLVAIPAIGLAAVPSALLGLLLYAAGLEQAAALAFQISLWVIDALWNLLEWFSAAAWSVWQRPPPPPWSVPLAVVGALLLLAPRAFPAKRTGLLWFVPLLAAPGGGGAPGPGEFRYTMLEVGHGLASVVQTRNRLLVYDAGPRFPGGLDTGETVVVPFLRQLGAPAIDALVVSHGDNDHSGGHRALLEHFGAKRVLTSVPEMIPGSQRCRAGQRWVWDEVSFEVLWPPPWSPQGRIRGNDASCVLKVSSAFGSVLLTGDIGKPAEEALVRSRVDLAAEVLQVPHHGSKTSSTAAFLERVRPALALASIGYLNRYGHPHESVRARYARRRIPVYHTAGEGAIAVSFSGAAISVRGHRGAERKYWLLPPERLAAQVRVRPHRRAAAFIP